MIRFHIECFDTELSKWYRVGARDYGSVEAARADLEPRRSWISRGSGNSPRRVVATSIAWVEDELPPAPEPCRVENCWRCRVNAGGKP